MEGTIDLNATNQMEELITIQPPTKIDDQGGRYFRRSFLMVMMGLCVLTIIYCLSNQQSDRVPTIRSEGRRWIEALRYNHIILMNEQNQYKTFTGYCLVSPTFQKYNLSSQINHTIPLQ